MVYNFYYLLNSSPLIKELMRQLSPAILRIGGSGADWTIFQDNTNPGQAYNNTGISPAFAIFTS
jgi:hypothetical protein